MNRSLAFLCVAILCLFSFGCCPKMNPFTITVIADPSIKDAAVAVHVAGVTVADHSFWENYSMTKYWQASDTTHTSKLVDTKILFDTGKPATQKIEITDDMWKTWLQGGATELVIMANLPRASEDKPGNADARRLMIPIDNCAYVDDLGKAPHYQEVQIQISKDRITLLTPLKPAE